MALLWFQAKELVELVEFHTPFTKTFLKFLRAIPFGSVSETNPITEQGPQGKRAWGGPEGALLTAAPHGQLTTLLLLLSSL